MARKCGLVINLSERVCPGRSSSLRGFVDGEVKKKSNAGSRCFMFFVAVLPRTVLPPVLTMSQEQSLEPVLPIGQEKVLQKRPPS